MKNPQALTQYRALDQVARESYDPSGKAGADAVRRLQKIAAGLAAAKIEGENIRRNARNPQFPDWRKTNQSLRALFDTVKYNTPELVRDARRPHLIPLGKEDEGIADAAARNTSPRIRNWGEPRSSLGDAKVGATINEKFQYSGKHKGRTGYIYHPAMECVARISNNGAIMCAIIGHSDGGSRPVQAHVVNAGRGYRWSDENGISLIRNADGADYHPTSDEIRAGRATIIAALRERADTRKKMAAAAKRDEKIIAAACKDGVWVGFRDALAAGNCRAGTESFVRRHALDARRHYRAEQLPRETGDTSRRVALAILASQRRQAHDQARGFCEI